MEMSREEWNDLYKRYPGDVVRHLLDRDNDLLSKWAAVVIENLRKENHEALLAAGGK